MFSTIYNSFCCEEKCLKAHLYKKYNNNINFSNVEK